MAKDKPDAPEFISGVAEPSPLIRASRKTPLETSATALQPASASSDPDIQYLLVILDAYLTAGDSVSAEIVRNRIKEKGYSA